MAEIIKEEKKYSGIADFHEMEIRGVKENHGSFVAKDGKTVETHSIEIMCDQGEDMRRFYFYDKNMGNLSKYKRGMIGTFRVLITVNEDFRTTIKMTVVDFVEDK